MKIEMGESLVYSWLRHEKGCQLVQTNWKVSPFWQMSEREQLQRFYEKIKQVYVEHHGYDITKGCSMDQFLKQAEIDAVGIAYSDGAPVIYAADVAFHENGLNYGSKEDTMLKLMQKSIRTAICMYGYFGIRTGEIMFISPKISPSLEVELNELFEEISTLMPSEFFDYTFTLLCNSAFTDVVLSPTVEKSSVVSDTSELFMRSIQLYHLSCGHQQKNVAKQVISKTPPAPRSSTEEEQTSKAITRIPQWAVKPDQNNHRIIRAYFQLQAEFGRVNRPALESRCQDPVKHPDVYVRDFRGNFSSMKTDKGKSHGRVFSDDGYNIGICPDVKETLEEYRSLFVE